MRAGPSRHTNAIIALVVFATVGALSTTAVAQEVDEVVDDTTELVDETADEIDDPVCVTDCDEIVPTPVDDGGDGGGDGGDDAADEPVDTVTEPITEPDDDRARDDGNEAETATSSSPSSASSTSRASQRSSLPAGVSTDGITGARPIRETQRDVAFEPVLGDSGYTSAPMPAWAAATDANSSARPGSSEGGSGRAASGDMLALALMVALILVAAGERYVARRR